MLQKSFNYFSANSVDILKYQLFKRGDLKIGQISKEVFKVNKNILVIFLQLFDSLCWIVLYHLQRFLLGFWNA